MFDGFINILVQELSKKPIRPHICVKEARTKLIEQLVNKILVVVEEKKLKPLKFAEIIEHMPIIKLDLPKSNLG